MATSDMVKASVKSVLFERDSFLHKALYHSKIVEQYNPILKSNCANR